MRWIDAVCAISLGGSGVWGCGAGSEAGDNALEAALTHALPAQAASPLAIAGLEAVEFRMSATLWVGDEARGVGEGEREARPSDLKVRRVLRYQPWAGGARFELTDERVFTERSQADARIDREVSDRVHVIFDGERLAERRGSGPWIERYARDGLPRRVLERALDLGGLGGDGAGMVLGAWGSYLVRTPIGRDAAHPARIGGIPVTWGRVHRDPEVRPRSLGADEVAALSQRDATVPLWFAVRYPPATASGELAVDAAGAIVQGSLELTGQTALGDLRTTFTFSFSQQVVALPSDAAFMIPQEVLAMYRERPWSMIHDVLGDAILGPYVK